MSAGTVAKAWQLRLGYSKSLHDRILGPCLRRRSSFQICTNSCIRLGDGR